MQTENVTIKEVVFQVEFNYYALSDEFEIMDVKHKGVSFYDFLNEDYCDDISHQLSVIMDKN